MATGAANLPFNMPQAPVAGFSPLQQQAFGEIQGLQGMAQPYFNMGQNYLQQSAAPVTGADVANYYNPMAANVTAQMQNIFGQQQRNTTGQLTQAAGGVGADRIAVGQSELANQQGLAAGQTYAGLYQQALQAAEQNKQMEAGAGMGIAQMGPAAMNAQMSGANQLLGAGGLQQQLSQAQMNAPYQQQLAQIAFPYQQAQYLAGITGGLSGAMGGTTTGNATTTYPTPSPLSQALGIGTAGLGMYGALGGIGGKGSLSSMGGMNGYGTQGMGGWYDRGGRAMADGGTPDDSPPMGFNAPGASPIRIGSAVIPTMQLPMTSGRSGPGGEFMQIRDLPMQPPGMPQNKQGTTGTTGDIAAATKFLNAIEGDAAGGAVEPMSYGQGYADGGGELGEVFPESIAADASPTPMEYDTGLRKPDVMPPDPPMGGGPMAGAPLPQPEAVSPMAAQAAPAPATPAPITDVPLPQPRPTFAPMGQSPTSALTEEQLRNRSSTIEKQEPSASDALLDRAAAVTREQETGGQENPYGYVKPTTNSRGHRQEALGAYGIMDFNLPQWSKAALGREVSKEEFLANPKLQDAIYRYKMGDYLKRFGVEGAGRAWLGGEGGVNAPLARDPLGTSVGSYGQRFAQKVGAAGDTSNMVAGPGAPMGRGDRLDRPGATPASAGPIGGAGPMGSSDFREPYPDALNRDWGQKATRSPWMSLVKAGAQMATTVGPIGSVIGQGIKAGAGELDEQRKALTGEEAINLKAKALHDTALYHLDAIAARRENSLARLQGLSGLPASALTRLQLKAADFADPNKNPDMIGKTREQREEYEHAIFQHMVAQEAEALRQQRGQQPAGGTPAATTTAAGNTPQTAEDDPGEGKRVRGHYYKTPEGTRQWTG
jgi:hypothetical protein